MDKIIKREELDTMDFSDVADPLGRRVPMPSPGQILLEDFLKPMGITQYRLAKEIGVPQRRIGEIVAGTRAITTDTGLRLSRFFGMSEGFWIALQSDYDRETVKSALAPVLARITPWHGGEAATR